MDTITKQKPLGLGKNVYLIKDECHIATSNLDILKDKYFEKTLNCSATPKLDKGKKADVQIYESDAVAVKLIKDVEYDMDSNLESAIDKFKEIKEQYINVATNDKNFGSLVNPCLIIQISNKEKAGISLPCFLRFYRYCSRNGVITFVNEKHRYFGFFRSKIGRVKPRVKRNVYLDNYSASGTYSNKSPG